MVSSSPTQRQAEYLAFIQAFTTRRGRPPSFEDIAQHFLTTAPSVNGMIKTLESRGFLTRVPGQARTLRVVVPVPLPDATRPLTPDPVGVAAHVACLVVEHLVPVLEGAGETCVVDALDAIAGALRAFCAEAGASAEDAARAQAALHQAARAARGPQIGASESRRG